MFGGVIALAVALTGQGVNAQTNSADVPTASNAVSATPTENDALAVKSAALSDADRAQTKAIFATAFTLWQSGDFAAAEIAFKRGLDIDPANALANYYYGDCLARRKDKADAKEYLARAVALGGNSVEAFKAQAELQQLAAAPTDAADMTQEEMNAALLGTWAITVSWSSGYEHHGTIQIKAIDKNTIALSGKVECCDAGDWVFTKGSLNGRTLNLVGVGTGFLGGPPDSSLEGSLVTPDRITGALHYEMGPGTFVAVKN
jgi:hypothetical protein